MRFDKMGFNFFVGGSLIAWSSLIAGDFGQINIGWCLIILGAISMIIGLIYWWIYLD